MWGGQLLMVKFKKKVWNLKKSIENHLINPEEIKLNPNYLYLKAFDDPEDNLGYDKPVEIEVIISPE